MKNSGVGYGWLMEGRFPREEAVRQGEWVVRTLEESGYCLFIDFIFSGVALDFLKGCRVVVRNRSDFPVTRCDWVLVEMCLGSRTYSVAPAGESQARDIADGPLACFLGSSWDPSVLDIYLAGLCGEKMNDGFIP